MIYVEKSDGVALKPLLDNAKIKNDANIYRSGAVYEQLKTDFHEKCYLCEDAEATSINIEHFEPHKGDLDKKFDWDNLFYSCAHCNNIKGDQFFPLLNCTDQSDNVWELVEIRLHPFPKTTIEVILHDGYIDKVKAENTRNLLEKSLAGKNTTPMKRDEAATLRKKMLRVYNNFQISIKNKDANQINEATRDSAPFAGMLRWILKNSMQQNG